MTSASFDPKTILDGIRRGAEIETPTEAPRQVNKLADLVAGGYRNPPANLARIAGCGDQQLCISPIEPRARLSYRPYQTLR